MQQGPQRDRRRTAPQQGKHDVRPATLLSRSRDKINVPRSSPPLPAYMASPTASPHCTPRLSLAALRASSRPPSSCSTTARRSTTSRSTACSPRFTAPPPRATSHVSSSSSSAAPMCRHCTGVLDLALISKCSLVSQGQVQQHPASHRRIKCQLSGSPRSVPPDRRPPPEVWRGHQRLLGRGQHSAALHRQAWRRRGAPLDARQGR